MPLPLHGAECRCPRCFVPPADRPRKGQRVFELRDIYAPTPFANGAVPTGAAWQPGSSGFAEGVVDAFPQIADDAQRMKWYHPNRYVYGLTIFFEASLMPDWIGAAIISARVGSGDLRAEWMFTSTGGQLPRLVYTPAREWGLGPLGAHTNELARAALRTGELGAELRRSGPRLRTHTPDVRDFSEPEVRDRLSEIQGQARRRRLPPARSRESG